VPAPHRFGHLLL